VRVIDEAVELGRRVEGETRSQRDQKVDPALLTVEVSPPALVLQDGGPDGSPTTRKKETLFAHSSLFFKKKLSNKIRREYVCLQRER